MPRFYCSQPLAAGSTVALRDSTARHIQVLRLRVGDTVTLFDGQGGEYAATLMDIDKKQVTAVVSTHSPREAELPFAITLAQALPEGAKMDWIVEKAVELGVAAIQPLAAQRSVVKLSGERMDKRQAHWQAIVVAAAEQCGRNRLATIEPLVDFRNWIAQGTEQPRILFSPRATLSLAAWARDQQPQAVTLVVGPEGGFTQEEETLAVQHNVLLLSLGARVLRTETAGIATIAALTALWHS